MNDPLNMSCVLEFMIVRLRLTVFVEDQPNKDPIIPGIGLVTGTPGTLIDIESSMSAVASTFAQTTL